MPTKEEMNATIRKLRQERDNAYVKAAECADDRADLFAENTDLKARLAVYEDDTPVDQVSL